MPWSNQSGGGWKGGGGGPWGQRPSSGGGGPGQTPDLEDLLRRGQDKLRQAMPGGGHVGGPMFVFIAVVMAGLIGFFGFTVRVNPDELGVVLRFGEYNRQLPPGLNFRWPYPVEQVYVPSVTRVNRIEVGMRGAIDGGQVVPVRDVPEESLMLTGDENIVDVHFVVFWRVNNAADFLFNIQNPAGTVKAVAESAMREVVGRGELQPVLTEARQVTENDVHELVQSTLNEYGSGIQITQVQMQKVDPPQQVIDSFRDVQAARADQERLQNEAAAYANKVIPEARGEAQRILQAAEGYKEQTVAEAEGQSARFVAIYEEYAAAPDVTRRRMFLETMERVLEDMDKVIIDEQSGGQGVVPYLPLNELMRHRQQPDQQVGQQIGQQGGQQ